VATEQRDVSASRLLRIIHPTQQVCKVSVAVSKLGYTNLIFIEPDNKINGQYYREMLLMQELLPLICSIAGDVFVFQQDNAPIHRAHDTVELLCHETPHSLIVISSVQPTLLTQGRGSMSK